MKEHYILLIKMFYKNLILVKVLRSAKMHNLVSDVVEILFTYLFFE